MALFCAVSTFRDAIQQAINLLNAEELGRRGTQPFNESNRCRCFLRWLLENIPTEINDYQNLLAHLQQIAWPEQFKAFAGLSGRLLDALQVLKPSALRHHNIEEAIRQNLAKTGHEAVWDALSEEDKERYKTELIKATASYGLLEVAYLISQDHGRNPISTLRDSMGARLPEEYFSNLLAGWVVEDGFKAMLESKGFTCTLVGVDKQRIIQLKRVEGMSAYDLQVAHNANHLDIEIQRVGKLSKPRGASQIKTALKKHKYEGGNGGEKILILWVGRLDQVRYQSWTQKIIIVRNITNNAEIEFADNNIRLPEALFDQGITWTQLQGTTAEEIRQMLAGG